MLGYMGRSFMAAIQPTLNESDAWNPETEEAWQRLFKWITYGMQRGYDSGGQKESRDQPLDQHPPISLAEVAENLQAIDVGSPDSTIEDENT